MTEPTAPMDLRDWPCTNPDHLGLCMEGHVHKDHVPAPSRHVAESDLQAMATTLVEHGYLVFKVPECKAGERGHGRHTLITRSGMCPGREPMPHGLTRFHQGSFGMWAMCSCGGSFATYTFADDADAPSPWDRHKAEVGIE